MARNEGRVGWGTASENRTVELAVPVVAAVVIVVVIGVVGVVMAVGGALLVATVAVVVAAFASFASFPSFASFVSEVVCLWVGVSETDASVFGRPSSVFVSVSVPVLPFFSNMPCFSRYASAAEPDRPRLCVSGEPGGLPGAGTAAKRGDDGEGRWLGLGEVGVGVADAAGVVVVRTGPEVRVAGIATAGVVGNALVVVGLTVEAAAEAEGEVAAPHRASRSFSDSPPVTVSPPVAGLLGVAGAVVVAVGRDGVRAALADGVGDVGATVAAVVAGVVLMLTLMLVEGLAAGGGERAVTGAHGDDGVKREAAEAETEAEAEEVAGDFGPATTR